MAMENELQKEGAWAPLTPAKPIQTRLWFGSINREWKNHVGGKFPHRNSINSDPNSSADKIIGSNDRDLAFHCSITGAENGIQLDMKKNITSFEGGSGKDFADNVRAGNFGKKDSRNSKGWLGKKGVTEFVLDVSSKVSFIELLLAPRQINQQNTSDFKTTIPCPSTPTNGEADAYLDIRRNCINVQTSPLPIQASSPQAIEKNSFEIPQTPPAINTQAAGPMNSFHIPVTDQDDLGVNKKLKQPQQRRRMKKHRPKVVVDGKLRKPPKTPKVPKTPRTRKTPKAPKTPKREPCKRVLDFNSNEKDKVKDEEDGQLLLVMKDDQQAEVKISSNAENRVEQDQVKDAEANRVVFVLNDDLQEDVKNSSKGSENEENDQVVLVPDDLQEEVKNGSKGSKIVEDGVQLADFKDFVKKHPTSKRSAQTRKRRFMKVINQQGHSSNSLIVYVRKLQPNQCQKNSRKLGPNFPKIFKKPRMRRQKKTHVETLLSIIALENVDRRVRKVQGRHKQIFTRVLSWGAKCVRKRSKTITRRRFLSSPTAKITPGQSLPLFPGQDNGNVIIPSSTSVDPVFDQFSLFHTGKDIGFINLPSPTALALNPESDQLSLPELGVVAPTYITPNCDQPSPLVQDVGSSSLRIDCEQIIPTSLQEVGIVRYGVHNSMKKSGNKKSKIVTPRQILSSPVKASMDDIEDCAPIDAGSSDFARSLINVIQGLEAFHIDGESNKQIVVQDQNSNRELVNIDPPKKPKKHLAKVDLDEVTLRVWNMLIENNGTDPFEEMDGDKEQWWKDQREIFRGRISSFIKCLHAIQGNRSFSPWKGSVVDSIVGVYLTQNVSDHLSSSAFMNLAAKFPAKIKSETGQIDLIVCCQEPDGSNEEADGQLTDEKENQLEMENQNENVIKDETPPTMSCPVSDAILDDETLTRSFCDGKSDPVPDIILKGSLLDENSHPVSDAIPNEILKGSFFDGNEVNVSDAISGEILKGSFYDGNVDPVLDAIPSEISKGSFIDGNATANETCVRGQQHLDVEDHLQKISSVPLDLNFPRWDPFGILGGEKSHFDGKNKRKHNGDINGPNASLGKNGAERGRNGVVRGKQAETAPRKKKTKAEGKPEIKNDWDELRKKYCSCRGKESGQNGYNCDSVDWEAVRCAPVDEISEIIKERGMNNVLANRIKEFLDRIFKDHGSLDLEWLRDVPPEKAKEYLLSINGLGLKSVECVRLLCLHHVAFPVDTNVARVAVRLGWVPLQPLANVMLHNLNAYPEMDSIQKYLWPRLLNLSQKELYELHYQMITFGKVFCTMKKPNCIECPMKKECSHYASATATVASDRYLTEVEEKRRTTANVPGENPSAVVTPPETLFCQEINISDSINFRDDQICEPIIEVPPSPGPINMETLLPDSGDLFIYSDDDEIPTLRLNTGEFREHLQNMLVSRNPLLEGEDLSRELVALTEEAASYPVRKLKQVERLKTVHQVYELPDAHPLLDGFERRHPLDAFPYILAIWTSATVEAVQPERCSETTCSSIQEFNQESAWGTIFIPCRTATRGAFPLGGTYFQVNEVFADDETSREPIRVPREWIWNLPRRYLYCGASASYILKGLKKLEIRQCFWEGFLCVRGFNRRTRMPQHLDQRFHVNTTIGKKRKTPDDE